MATIEHTVISGQSLSVGNSGQPGISTVAENAALEALPAGTLVPLRIGQDPSADHPANERLEFALGYRLADARAGVTTATSTDGQGASTVAELAEGGTTGEYEALVSRVAATRAAVQAAGDTYKLRALHWVQGEADQTAGSSRAQYVAALDALHASYMEDLAVDALPMLLSQTSTQNYAWSTAATTPTSPLAQLDLHRTRDWCTLVGPHYALPRESGGQLHLNGHGYYHMGELHARASLAEINGAGWDPLMPVDVDYGAQTIAVTFAVPVEPLVLDTTLVAAQPNHGFSLHGTDAQITSVTVTAPDRVEISIDRPVIGRAQIGYAVGPAVDTGRGNLRDSEPAVSVHDGAPLPNWSVLFLEDIPVPSYRKYRVGGLTLRRADGGRVPLTF